MKGIPSEQEWIQIIRGEFLEIPGLRLTRDQILRLWGLHRDAGATVLENLLHQRFLRLTADGHYVRGVSAGSRHASLPSRKTEIAAGSALADTPAATRIT